MQILASLVSHSLWFRSKLPNPFRLLHPRSKYLPKLLEHIKVVTYSLFPKLLKLIPAMRSKVFKASLKPGFQLREVARSLPSISDQWERTVGRTEGMFNKWSLAPINLEPCTSVYAEKMSTETLTSYYSDLSLFNISWDERLGIFNSRVYISFECPGDFYSFLDLSS